MSLTTPTYFEDYYWREGQINNTIVKLVQGANTYYLSQTDMQVGAIHVHGLLEKSSGMKDDINVMQKTWKVSQVKLTFSNLPFLVDASSGVKKRLSDLLFNIRGSEAIIFLQAGKTIPTDIETNCLERFKGIVALEPTYDDEQLIIQLTDKLVFDDVQIPNIIMSSIYPNTPSEYANDPIPLVFGKFTISGDDTNDFNFTGKGLAIGVPTEIAYPTLCVVSDHILHDITAMHLKLDGFDDPAIYDSPALTVDDSDRGTASPTAGELAKAYMYAVDNDDADYDTSGYGSPTDPENACDRDITTHAKILDSSDDGTDMFSEATWRLANPSALNSLFYERGILIRIQGYLNDLVSMNPGFKQAKLVGINGDTTGFTDIDYLFATPAWYISNATNWTPTLRTPENYDAITIRGARLSWANADGINDNWSAGVVAVHSLRVRLEFRPSSFNAPSQAYQVASRISPEQRGGMLPSSNPGTPSLIIKVEPLNTPVFVACEGLEYNSDITGRSSAYADGDVIEDPAGIVEWLLRTQLSYVDADIDLTTFIDAENTNVKMRMNLHKANKAYILTIIRGICEQSTFTFFMSAAGKAKLIPLNDQSPTTARIIKHSQLVKGKLKISKLSSIIETMNVKSRYQAEYDGIFRDYDTYTNTGADGLVHDADWPNIAGTSAQHVARHLIKKIDGSDSNDDGLWANEHFQIEVETFGFINADLQVGDWIELEAASFDDQLKAVFPLTASWDGQQFLITTIIQKLDSTYIKAIHLFEDV